MSMVGIRHGITHACYRINLQGRYEAWCSLVECIPCVEERAVDCMWCIADIKNDDDDDVYDVLDDELDPYSPDESDR